MLDQFDELVRDPEKTVSDEILEDVSVVSTLEETLGSTVMNDDGRVGFGKEMGEEAIEGVKLVTGLVACCVTDEVSVPVITSDDETVTGAPLTGLELVSGSFGEVEMSKEPSVAV